MHQSLAIVATALAACASSSFAQEANAVSHGPLLGRPAPTSMSIWARTRRPGTFVVEYAPAGSEDGALRHEVTTNVEQDNTGVATLEGLAPSTRYSYRVFSKGSSPPKEYDTFRTWPNAAAVRNDEHNPDGLFNLRFEFACGNSQSNLEGRAQQQPTFETLLRDHAHELDFAILNGDWLYEASRTYPLERWMSDVGVSDLPTRLEFMPRIVGVWANYKTYLDRGLSMARFHRRVPSLFTIDDHEILNDIAGCGQAGVKIRRTVLRDVGVQAWMDYLGWSNPTAFPSGMHLGRARLEAGSDVLEDLGSDFSQVPLEELANLHVHWGGERFSERLKARDEYPGLPNAGVYDIVERIDEHHLRIAPAATEDSSESVYSIGQHLYGDFQVANCHFFLLDTRSHRDLPDYDQPDRSDRSMLGAKQLAWLREEIAASEAEFLFIVSSVNFMIPHTEPTAKPGAVPKKGEAWTVFLHERELLLNEWDQLDRPVFLLTGDLHNSFAIQVSDNVWEFASGPHESTNHHIGSEGHRPPNGSFQYGPRDCEILWSTYHLTDTARADRRTPSFCVVQINNVTNCPDPSGADRWVAFPRPQVVFQFYDGVSGELKFAQSISASRD